MYSKTMLCHAISLLVFTQITVSMVELNSEMIRPTDIIYKKVEEDDQSEETFTYKDFSLLETDNVKKASVPDETFLQIFPGSDAVVSKALNPLEVIVIKRPDAGLGLPGGFNNYGETGLDGAIRKFKERVHFDVEGQTFSAEPVAGLLGMPDLMSLGKHSQPIGPYMGTYAMPERDPSRHVLASLYHLMIDEKYVNPKPVEEKSEEVHFCNILELLARNMSQITDNVEEHPLAGKTAEVLDNDKKVMAEEENKEKEIGEVIPCAQKFDNDYLVMIYRYYQRLVTFKIINADGSNGSNFDKHPFLYNKTILMKKIKEKNSNNILL